MEEKRGGGAALRAGAAALAVLAGLALGLCLWAAGCGGVFPGVTVAGVPLGGLSRADARARLEAALPAWVDGDSVTVTADGETLGTWPRGALGAYAVAGEAAGAAWAVGRAPGLPGFFQNGWTLARGLLGRETALTPTLCYDEAALAEAVGSMAAAFDRAPADGAWSLTAEGLFATKHRSGRALDQAALTKLLAGAAETVEAPWTALPARTLDLSALAASLPAEPSPARYDIAGGRVVEGTVGVRLDAEAARLALDAVAEGETLPLPAEILPPELTARELEAVLFRDLLGTASTQVGGTAARRNNVRLAAEAVNGTVLNHGDEFDFNRVVGQRTEDRGYGEAASYVNGETVNTVGGGICQVSSTLYLAALLSDLTITERHAHRYYPGYITLGMDATVSWGGPEFRFKNDTGYPLRIDASYGEGRLTVSIYGTRTDGVRVEMSREVLSTTGYETEYVETEELPWGAREEKQSGYTGYEVESYRSRYDGENNLLSRTLEAKSSYKSRNRIILVGVAGRPGGDTPPPDAGTGEPAPPESGGTPAPAPPTEGGP